MVSLRDFFATDIYVPSIQNSRLCESILWFLKTLPLNIVLLITQIDLYPKARSGSPRSYLWRNIANQRSPNITFCLSKIFIFYHTWHRLSRSSKLYWVLSLSASYNPLRHSEQRLILYMRIIPLDLLLSTVCPCLPVTFFLFTGAPSMLSQVNPSLLSLLALGIAASIRCSPLIFAKIDSTVRDGLTFVCLSLALPIIQVSA